MGHKKRSFEHSCLAQRYLATCSSQKNKHADMYCEPSAKEVVQSNYLISEDAYDLVGRLLMLIPFQKNRYNICERGTACVVRAAGRPCSQGSHWLRTGRLGSKQVWNNEPRCRQQPWRELLSDIVADVSTDSSRQDQSIARIKNHLYGVVMVKLDSYSKTKLRKRNKISAYTRQKAKSKYGNLIRLVRASQSNPCRERKINIKTSERVNVDVGPIHAKQTVMSPTQANPFLFGGGGVEYVWASSYEEARSAKQERLQNKVKQSANISRSKNIDQRLKIKLGNLFSGWTAGFFGALLFLVPLHFAAASPSPHFTFTNAKDSAGKRRPKHPHSTGNWTGDRDVVHFEPPKLAVRNLDPSSAAIVDNKINESEIQNHEISLVQHFYIGTKYQTGSMFETRIILSRIGEDVDATGHKEAVLVVNTLRRSSSHNKVRITHPYSPALIQSAFHQSGIFECGPSAPVHSSPLLAVYHALSSVDTCRRPSSSLMFLAALDCTRLPHFSQMATTETGSSPSARAFRRAKRLPENS
ncbi:hypothetical protein PR048_001640 [Dryococelus australis]|uniref:Uncharacterized protein n=1 Tax=Dryococelus australis TaxID=614101 RepID=A0ABQ9II21_9NEOP|nr:hypothetical protein PR048_001640 [Dryococelus australis]